MLLSLRTYFPVFACPGGQLDCNNVPVLLGWRIRLLRPSLKAVSRVGFPTIGQLQQLSPLRVAPTLTVIHLNPM